MFSSAKAMTRFKWIRSRIGGGDGETAKESKGKMKLSERVWMAERRSHTKKVVLSE